MCMPFIFRMLNIENWTPIVFPSNKKIKFYSDKKVHDKHVVTKIYVDVQMAFAAYNNRSWWDNAYTSL